MELILQDLLRQENPYDFEVQCVIAAGHGVDADAVGAVAKTNCQQLDRQSAYLKSKKAEPTEKVDTFPKISDDQHRKEVRDLQAAAQLAGVAFTSPECIFAFAQLALHLAKLCIAMHEVLRAHYAPSQQTGGWVSVEAPTDNAKLDALALNDTNKLEIRVFANEDARQAVLFARLDNLGKGASGAAVQNIQLMLGL